MTVYPPRNLPGTANEWGRAIETELASVERSLTSEFSSIENRERASSGQLATSGSIIDELMGRSSEVITLPNMSVTGSAVNPPFPTSTQVATFPAVPGSRYGLIVFNAKMSDSGFGRGYVFLKFQGQVISRSYNSITSGSPTNPNESPTGLEDTFCRVLIPGNVPVPITVELVRGPGSTSSTVSLTDISITLTRSGAI